MTTIKNLSSKDRKIKTIFHIADIHVRTGTDRVEEYESVFQSLLEISACEDVQNGNALLLIAGDLYHHKGRVDSTGGKMMFDFINSLLEVIPVLIICGNHDMRQEDIECTDMISFLVSPYSRKDRELHYLSETGLYKYDNVGFGIVSIKDTLRANNTFGICDRLPDFPDPALLDNDPMIDVKVALFHGSLSGTVLSSGRKHNPLGQRYEITWFRGYDIAMLGDNHKQQIINSTDSLSWAYPGSLVQQDFGESVSGHGYVKWDVVSKIGTTHDLPNDFGRITIKIENDSYKISITPSVFLSFEEVDRAMIPKRARVRVISSGRESPADIARAMERIGISRPTEVYYTSAMAVNMPIETTLETPLESPRQERDSWEEYVRERGCDPGSFVSDPERAFLVPSSSSGEARNKKIRDMAMKFLEMIDAASTKRDRVVFTRMRWKNMFCYGNTESDFNFEAAGGSIVQIYGKNAYGKSAFMDVLCIGLFGQPLDQEFAKVSDADKIIYDGSDSAEVTISLKIVSQIHNESNEFSVKRKFTMKRGIMKHTAEVMRGNEIVAEGLTMVSKWINETVGTAEDMQMSSFLAQNDLSSFFFKKSTDQKSMLEKAFHLDNVTFFESIIDESLNAHAFALKEATSIRDSLEADVKNLVDLMGTRLVDDDSIEAELDSVKSIVNRLNAERDVHLKTLAVPTEKNFIDKIDEEALASWLECIEREGIPDSEPVSGSSLEKCKNKVESTKKQIDALCHANIPEGLESELEAKMSLLVSLGIRKPSNYREILNIQEEFCTFEGFKERELNIGFLTATKPVPRKHKSQREAHELKMSHWKTLEDRVSKICRSRSEIQGILETLEKKREITDLLKKLNSELAKLSKSKIELNSECHACRQNPVFIRRKEIEEETLIALESLKCLETCEGEDATKLLRELSDLDEYSSKKEDVLNDVREWELAEEEFREVDRIDGEVQKRTEFQWNAYSQETSRIACELKKFKDSKTYRDLKTYYDESIGSYMKDSLLRKKWLLATGHRRCVASAELSRISELLASYEKRSSDLSKQSAVATIIRSKTLTLSIAIETAKTVMDRTQTLKEFRNAFSGLRSHLYTTKVVPEVERNINSFVSLFSDFRVVVSEVTGKKGVNIAFHIEDRGCRPPLERASGFQKFVVNLAMRISLSRIGSIGQNVGHMFLDEGFVACDAANLRRSTNLLREIMRRGGYESIFIMTHLELLEDAADHKATIQRSRDNKSSFLVWPNSATS